MSESLSSHDVCDRPKVYVVLRRCQSNKYIISIFTAFYLSVRLIVYLRLTNLSLICYHYLSTAAQKVEPKSLSLSKHY